MPQIFDNIEQQLLPTLSAAMGVSDRADFCVGFFNLRGWKQIDSYVEAWQGGDGHCCRLLVGMQQTPQEELRSVMGVLPGTRSTAQQLSPLNANSPRIFVNS